MTRRDKTTSAAVTIQKYWRGYHTRKRIAKAQGAFAHLQRLFRLRLEKRREEVRLTDEKRNRQLNAALERCKNSRLALERRFQLLFNRDPDLVDEYVRNERRRAAVLIQSFWRGFKARRKYGELRWKFKREGAAAKIQKCYRRHLLKRKWRKTSDVWPKLTDSRRSELQTEVIDQWIQEKRPVPSVRQLELKLAECEDLIAVRSAVSLAEGRNFQRRRVLLAKLQLDSETLEAAPKLSQLSDHNVAELISTFKSHSTTVDLAAKQLHNFKMDSAVGGKWWLIESAAERYD